MSPVTGVISSCSNCKKVHSLAEKLIVNMQAFEVFTMEMELDPKSAKLKSREVIKNFWELILMVKSIKIVEKEETGKDLDGNQNILIVDAESHEKENSESEESENESVKSPAVHRRKRQRQKLMKPKPILIASKQRLDEEEKANKFLQTIKCETPQGFYNLFECLKCQRQFSGKTSASRHVKVRHLNLGTPCPTCSQKYFDAKLLELHILKCSKREQFNKIKVLLKNDRKNPVKVHLHPHEKQKQTSQPKNPIRKFQDQQGKPRKSLDPLKIKVSNPFPNFNVEETLEVKVVTERLKMDKSGGISSVSQTPTRTEIEIETGKEMNLFEAAENESESMN